MPEAVERVYSGWHGIGYHHPEAGYVVGLFPQEGCVRVLFEHGVHLPDPAGVLEGDGSQTRHADLVEWDEALVAALEDLVAAAIELRS